MKFKLLITISFVVLLIFFLSIYFKKNSNDEGILNIDSNLLILKSDFLADFNQKNTKITLLANICLLYTSPSPRD